MERILVLAARGVVVEAFLHELLATAGGLSGWLEEFASKVLSDTLDRTPARASAIAQTLGDLGYGDGEAGRRIMEVVTAQVDARVPRFRAELATAMVAQKGSSAS
jgi:hypothetical protein